MDRVAESHFHLPYAVFDSHFHTLHMLNQGMDVHNILHNAFSHGLAGGVDVAIDENQFEWRLNLIEQHRKIKLSAGIHPSSCHGAGTPMWEERFSIIKKQAQHSSVVAVGETGLDFFRDYVSYTEQEQSFREHLNLANQLNKPVIVHNRDADERVLKLIKESSCRLGVLHCFSSDWDTAKAGLDMGFFISLAGNITYKKMHAIQDTIKKIPPNRLLIETDSPYLSPQNVRRQKNHPGHVGYVLEALAEIRKEDTATLSRQTVENSHTLFLLREDV